MLAGLLDRDVTVSTVFTPSTLNPADKTANVTLTNGDLTASFTSVSDGGVRSVSSKTSGKYYVEFAPGATWSGADNGFGIALAAANLSAVGLNAASAGIIFAGANPPLWFNGVFSGVNLKPTNVGTLIGMVVDLNIKRLWFINYSQGNEWNGLAATNDPNTSLGGLDISALFPGTGAYIIICANQNGASATLNLGSSPFSEPVPTGCVAGWPS